MHYRILIGSVALAGGLSYALFAQPGGDNGAKEALQELQEFVGGWKGNGTSEQDKTAIWREAMNWEWRFKGNDSWLALAIKESKFYKGGELRYMSDKKIYQLSLIDKNEKTLVFNGALDKSALTLQRIDSDSKETQQLKWNTAAAGDRLVLVFSVMPEGRTAFTRQWQIGMTREGVTLGTGKKNPECIVTGGLGTMPVSHNGVTYYVCCSGCRDAFNENPQKFIKELQDKKKK